MILTKADYREIDTLFNQRSSEITLSNYDDIYLDTKQDYIRKKKERYYDDLEEQKTVLKEVKIKKHNLDTFDHLEYYFDVHLTTNNTDEYSDNYELAYKQKTYKNFFNKNEKRFSFSVTKTYGLSVNVSLIPIKDYIEQGNTAYTLSEINYNIKISDCITDECYYKKSEGVEYINYINTHNCDKICDLVKEQLNGVLTDSMFDKVKDRMNTLHNDHGDGGLDGFTKVHFNNGVIMRIMSDYDNGCLFDNLSDY